MPLGLTAGVDAEEPKDADGLVSLGEEGIADGTLPLRMGVRRGGLENAPNALVALATSFEQLGLGGEEEANAPLVFSALVKTVEGLPWALEGVEERFERAFLGLPSAVSLRGRTFQRSGPVAGSSFTRLDVGSSWGGEWAIYLSDDLDTFTLPVPPEGHADRLYPTTGDEEVEVLLQSARLSDAAIDRERLVGFDDLDLDDLGGLLEAFSTREIFRER